MIFQAPIADGKYRIAKVDVEGEEGEITEDWWVVPEAQVIKWNSEGGVDIFKWPSVPKDQIERFQGCAEFRGLNKAHMLALDTLLKRNTTNKCITVFYGDGESSTLDAYVKSGKDPALITSAPDLPDYYKAPEQ